MDATYIHHTYCSWSAFAKHDTFIDLALQLEARTFYVQDNLSWSSELAALQFYRLLGSQAEYCVLWRTSVYSIRIIIVLFVQSYYNIMICIILE